MKEQSLTILIPAYNEEKSLPEFLPTVLNYAEARSWKVLVVNDGSKDDTANIVRAFMKMHNCLQLVSHKVNRGYGGALKSGVRAAETKYVVTIDADGQHFLEDIDKLLAFLLEKDADMVVGSREGQRSASIYRGVGKSIIRFIAKLLMPVNIFDINSGMKMYDVKLAQGYLSLCPDSMAYSDIIALVFISQRHLVVEHPINIRKRIAGTSTISTRTAFETLLEIVNIVILFNPMKIFLPMSMFFVISGLLWGLPIVLRGDGVSSGALLGVMTGILFFFLGLITEQLTLIRKKNI